jgi:membrane-bound lytic murein transglycosylase MltF
MKLRYLIYFLPFIFSCKIQSPLIPYIFESEQVTVLDHLEKINNILPKDLRYLSLHLYQESVKNDIDYLLVLAIIKVESRFNKYAVSYKGAKGLFQLMPIHGVDLENEREYISKSIEFIKWLKKFTPDSLEMILASYNFGRSNVLNKKLPRETREYIYRVKCVYVEYLNS